MNKESLQRKSQNNPLRKENITIVAYNNEQTLQTKEIRTKSGSQFINTGKYMSRQSDVSSEQSGNRYSIEYSLASNIRASLQGQAHITTENSDDYENENIQTAQLLVLECDITTVRVYNSVFSRNGVK